jgi:hypothetical protein
MTYTFLTEPNIIHIAQKVPLELSGRVFSTNLIILCGQAIDVILGMDCMKLHKAIFMLELDKYVMLFTDGILIYSKSMEEHE